MPPDIRARLRDAFTQARDFDGSMSERLEIFVSAAQKHHPESVAIVDRFVARLRAHQAGENTPKVDDPMPPFVLPDESGRLVKLADLLVRGPVVITFHRGHWCPYCRISMNTLSKALTQIEALGARMVAVVPDRQQFAEEMKQDAGAMFPVLTDMDNGYAMSLNLAIWVGGEMREYMISIGRDLPSYQGNDAWMLPIPATFVVAPDGRIKARFIDPDFRRRMDVEDLVAALK
jgi:peroxiredoxin